jgi:DNA-binding NtrC family response regulator
VINVQVFLISKMPFIMKKFHIVLVENRENEIEFFTDSLKASGLDFFCNTARSVDQAMKILKNSLPDAVFIDKNIVTKETDVAFRKFKVSHNMPIIFYSTVQNVNIRKQVNGEGDYVQFPASINTMAHILKNLLI